jgi:histidinol-phosphate aminotransferase
MARGRVDIDCRAPAPGPLRTRHGFRKREEMQDGPQDLIDLSLNENPLGPSPKALAAVAEELARLNRYPDMSGAGLRHALAEHLRVEPDQIAIGNGADNLIMQLCLAYLDRDTEVIVSHSSFPVYDQFAQVMKAPLIKVPLKEYRLDLDAMAQAISHRTRLVFVCNPNNPTGTIVTAAEVAAFVDRVPDHTLVVFDEAYGELVASDAFPDTLAYIRQGRLNVMVLRTFSKVYGLAGIRLGYGVAMPSVLAPLAEIREPFAVNRLAQVAGLAALKDTAFLEKTVTANHEGRLFLYHAFDRLGLRYAESHTNFCLVEVGPQAAAVSQRLFDGGIRVRPCAGYDLPDHLRVTVGDSEQNARLVEALEEALGQTGELNRIAQED